MEYYEKELCATFDELTGGEDPVINRGTLLKRVTRGSIRCVNRGGGEGNRALYVYSTLPDRYKQRFVEKYGRPEDLLRREVLRAKVVPDEAAEAYFETFEYDLNGMRKTLSEDKRREYVTNAMVLNALVRDLNLKRALTKALNNGPRDLWGLVYDLSEDLREVYAHTLPGSVSRLRAKVRAYQDGGYRTLLSGKLGNRNTVKVTPEGRRLLIALRRSKVPVYTIGQMLEAYNERAKEKGWKPLACEATLRGWLEQPEVKALWLDAVQGEQQARITLNRRHKTELPTRRDALWYGDGTKLNLYYLDGHGKVRTTMVYEVMDAATEMLLGYHVSDTEDYIDQYHAYRMAIQTSGHKPYEIVHDNQGGHKKANSGGLLDKICKIHRATAPYNGASKTIEQAFGHFQAQVLHKNWNFTGQNVTAVKLGSRPDLEFVEANKDKLPTWDELLALYAKARQEWNDGIRPGTAMSRRRMYETSENPETEVVTPRGMIDLFWMRTKKPVTFTAQGIEITVGKRKHRYEVCNENGMPDHEWRRRNTLRKFVVEYDPYDMLKVRLYSVDKAGGLRFETWAGPYVGIHRAIQEQTEGEAAFIRKEQEAAWQDRLTRLEEAKTIEYEHGVAPEQHGLHSPIPKGLTKAQQMELERRTRRYAMPPEPSTLGSHTKQVSMLTWDEMVEWRDKGERCRRTAEKL